MKYFLVYIFLSFRAFALNVSPLTNQFDISKNELSKTYEVRNLSEYNSALEISVFSRTHKNGKEINERIEHFEKDFKIFPKSLIIPPNQIKSVRITYIGSKELNQEKSYRIVFTEKPIKNDPRIGVKKVLPLIEFKTSAFVLPKEQNRDIEYKIISEDIKEISIYFKNKGNIHQSFENAILKVSNNNDSYEINSRESSELMFNLLPEESKVIKIQKKNNFKNKGSKLNLKFL